MTNPSAKALRVVDIRRTCTCTEASISKRLLQPGATADLTLKLSVRPVLRDWSIHCTLFMDSTEEPERTYTLRYRSYPGIRFEDETVNLGSRATGPGGDHLAGTTWIETYSPASGPPVSIAPVRWTGPVQAAITDGPKVELIDRGTVRRARYRVELAVPPEPGAAESPGTHSGSVTAETGSGRSASASVVWTVVSPLVATPSSVYFGTVGLGRRDATKKVIIRATDGSHFRLMGANSGRPEVQARIAEADGPNPSRVVALTCSPLPTSPRYLAGRAVFRTDHPRAPRLEILWSAVIGPDTAAQKKGAAQRGKPGFAPGDQSETRADP